MTEETAAAQRKITGYAEAYLLSYAATIVAEYAALAREADAIGERSRLFPLLGRTVGLDTGLAVLGAAADFFLFFIDEPGITMKAWSRVGAADGFDLEWVLRTPNATRVRKAREILGLQEREIIGFANTPGTDFAAHNEDSVLADAPRHGALRANRDAAAAEAILPSLRAAFDGDRARDGFRARYQDLLEWAGTPQTRGIEFERLWREVLGFYGWHPRKITLAGEDDDFTAMRNTAHVLGEVRWFSEPMNGGKAREFLAKFDPRPATIGLFISFSGFDEGARSVLRRAVGSTSVVLFDRPEIDEILLGRADPGPLFDEKLREVYDYLFENQDNR